MKQYYKIHRINLEWILNDKQKKAIIEERDTYVAKRKGERKERTIYHMRRR